MSIAGQSSTTPLYPPLSDADLIPDSAVSTSLEDEFEHEQIADRRAQLVSSVETPSTVALYGPWGSGKSSIFPLVKEKLDNAPGAYRLVRYDAWRFSGTSLKRHFVLNAARELAKYESETQSTDWVTERLYETSTASRFAWQKVLKKFALAGLISGVALAIVGVVAGWSGSGAFSTDFRGGVERSLALVSPIFLFAVGAIPFIEFLKVSVSRGPSWQRT